MNFEKKMKKRRDAFYYFQSFLKKKPVKFIQRFSADKKGGVMIRGKKRKHYNHCKVFR